MTSKYGALHKSVGLRFRQYPTLRVIRPTACTAVTMRDGWADAEARAKDTEQMFEPSERRFLGIVLRILDATRHITLSNDDIAIVFTRRNYENMQNKVQVFATLRAIENFPPLLAYEISGITPDPTRGWLMEQEYAASQERKKLEAYKAVQIYVFYTICIEDAC